MMESIPKNGLAALFYGPGDVRVESVPVELPAAGEVLVRIGAALTCGTDQKTFRRGHPVIIKSIPSLFGHEMAGTVVAVGEGVTRVTVGTRVVVANSVPCFSCYYCERGEHNLCENIEFLNGAYSQYLRVPAKIVAHNLHIIGDRVPFAVAALAEPLACVLHATRHVRIAAGETIAILGTGPMAMLFVQVARVIGAQAIVIGRSEMRLRIAREAGALATVNNTSEDVAAVLRQHTRGRGVDVAIEAIGDPATWQQMVALVRRGGRVCLYGGCVPGTTLTLDTYRLHYEEITVSGVFHHTPPLFAEAVAWLDQGKIDASFYTQQRRGLKDLAEIYSGKTANPPLKYVIET